MDVCDDGDNTGERMMVQLDQRMETISGEFNSQVVPNTNVDGCLL